MNSLDNFAAAQRPTALRPLLGVTILIVEDSRFVCEAVRLLSTRSGARIRRADSINNARRHLAIYRPSVIIIDIGLPDGSGLGLIESLSLGSPKLDVILATSGDPDMADAALASGADGFLTKPIASLATFQTAILEHLPRDRQPPGPRKVQDEEVEPDPIAYRDDLAHAAQILEGGRLEDEFDYITQFLSGVARSADDTDLQRAVSQLNYLRKNGAPTDIGFAKLSALVRSRLANAAPM